MSYFYFKKGDRLPPIEVTAEYDDETPVDVTGGTVTFSMWDYDTGVYKITDAVGAIVDATQGKIKYDWGATDTDTAGEYLAKFEVTLAGKQLSVPNRGLCNIFIEDP